MSQAHTTWKSCKPVGNCYASGLRFTGSQVYKFPSPRYVEILPIRVSLATQSWPIHPLQIARSLKSEPPESPMGNGPGNGLRFTSD